MATIICSILVACSLIEPGASEEIVRHVGWVDAMPDTRTTVEFEINGTTLSFAGVGYHDKARMRFLTAILE